MSGTGYVEDMEGGAGEYGDPSAAPAGAAAGGWGRGEDDAEFGGDGGAASYDEDLEVSSEDDEYDGLLDGMWGAVASEEVKAVSRDIKRKTAMIERLKEKSTKIDERVVHMKEHVKQVNAALKQTQDVLSAKEKEQQTEIHLKALSERRVEGDRAKLRSLDLAMIDLQDRSQVLQASLVTNRSKVEKLREKIGFTESEMETWEEAARQKEEDHDALRKYSRADEQQINALTLDIQKKSVLLARAKETLDMEITNTQSKQVELDKTAAEFRALHVERQTLVAQWQDALVMVGQNDRRINKVGEEYAEESERFDAAVRRKRKKAAQLERMEKKVQILLAEIAKEERKLAVTRSDYAKEVQINKDSEAEGTLVHAELAAASNVVAQTRSEIGHATSQVERTKTRLDTSRAKLRVATQQQQLAETKVLDAESAAREVDAMCESRKSQLSALQSQLQRLKTLQFRRTQELFEKRTEETALQAEIDSSRSAIRNLEAEVAKRDKEALRQQELVYHAEFQIQQLERKVARASGERTTDEKAQLEERIAALTVKQEEHSGVHKLLISQKKRLDEELKKATREQARLLTKQAKLDGEITELGVTLSSAKAQLRKLEELSDGKIVQRDVTRLEVKKRKELLSEAASELFALENEREQLRASMEERRSEISVQLETKKASLKMQEEARHNVAKEKSEHEKRRKAVQAKYETMHMNGEAALAQLQGPDGDGPKPGESLQAHFLIKAVQIREELQRKGDALDGTLRRKEKECRMLQHTLTGLTKQNTKYRSSFAAADPTSSDAQMVRRLDQASRQAKDINFKRRRELRKLKQELEEDRKRGSELDQRFPMIEMHSAELRSMHDVLVGELDALERQLRDMDDDVRAQSMEHRAEYGVSSSEATPAEKSMLVENLRIGNANVLCVLEKRKERRGLAREAASPLRSCASYLRTSSFLPLPPPSGSRSASWHMSSPRSDQFSRSSCTR